MTIQLLCGCRPSQRPREKVIAFDTDCTGLRMRLFRCPPPTVLQLDWEMEVGRDSRDRKGYVSSWSNFEGGPFLRCHSESNQSRSYGPRAANFLIFSLKQFLTMCRFIGERSLTWRSVARNRSKCGSS